MGYAIVFLGAGIGGALRHGVNLAAVRYFGFGFPFGTLVVNILGSFAMGLFAGYFAYRTGLPQHLRLFLTTGLLGGFTTFSAFSLDTVLLVERHAYGAATAYVAVSVAISLAALFAGLAIFQFESLIP
jgi:fluoride exporter